MRSRLRSLALIGAVLACKPGLPLDPDASDASETDADGETTFADTDEQPCDFDTLHACNDAAAFELESCMSAWQCGDFRLMQLCQAEFGGELEACRAAACPGEPLATSDCVAACDYRSTHCAEQGCDADTCAYEWLLCTDHCEFCNAVEFTFSYAGGCELTPPGPPPPWHLPYIGLEIGGQRWGMSAPGLTCEDPDALDAVWTSASTSTVRLCDVACEAFATAGSAAVIYGSPPCG